MQVRLDEVAEALSIDWEASEGPFFSSSFQLLDTEDILVMCSSLVTVSRVIIKDRENPSGREVKEIRLAHFSVKEFLISERIRNSSVSHFAILDQTAHAYISQCCIVYLLQFEVDLNEEMLGQFPLAKYAARYWIDHVQISKQGESNETIQRLALKLLQPNRLPYVNWCRLFDPDKPWNDEGLVDSCTAVSPLYYTSVSGFHWLSSLILERGDDPNAEGGIYGNPLQAAAFKGHESIVRLLLREGAKINLRSGFMGNALVAAVQGGHESIVNLLLEKGADVNASRFGLSNALQEAAAMGNPKITQLLLDYGAKVNEINRKSGKGLPLEEAVNRGYDDITTQLLPKANLRSLNAAIRASSRRGDWNICEALLNRGADVNLSLCHAAGGGFENIVQKLIERNANVNGVVGFPSNNPLIAAAIAGHESVVQQLLASGADGSQSTPSYVNALQAAAKFGRTSIAQLLLDAHVDVNAHGKRGTALEGAAMSGHLDTVMLLLDHGADPNLKGEYGSALYYAADSGRLEIVQELLKRGADVNKPGGIRGTAIQAAAEENHPFIVQYLMERGAEVNTNNESGSVLQSAACNGNDALVRLLLSAGAHIECQDGHNGSPLRRAIDNGRLDTIKLLIEEGADVNRHSGSMGSRSKSPLTCSVGRGDKNSVRFLLENGASVNDQDDAGFTAIHHAARAGHDELLAVLVDEFGADLQLRLINGSLGIHSAARYGAERCLGFFLNHGLEVDSQNFEGRTPLHFAAEAGEKGAVQFLLNNGADRELAESKTRMTALDFVELHLRTTHWSREGEQERWEEIARILRV